MLTLVFCACSDMWFRVHVQCNGLEDHRGNREIVITCHHRHCKLSLYKHVYKILSLCYGKTAQHSKCQESFHQRKMSYYLFITQDEKQRWTLVPVGSSFSLY